MNTMTKLNRQLVETVRRFRGAIGKARVALRLAIKWLSKARYAYRVGYHFTGDYYVGNARHYLILAEVAR
jgi:hypothetical protein